MLRELGIRTVEARASTIVVKGKRPGLSGGHLAQQGLGHDGHVERRLSTRLQAGRWRQWRWSSWRCLSPSNKGITLPFVFMRFLTCFTLLCFLFLKVWSWLFSRPEHLLHTQTPPRGSARLGSSLLGSVARLRLVPHGLHICHGLGFVHLWAGAAAPRRNAGALFRTRITSSHRQHRPTCSPRAPPSAPTHSRRGLCHAGIACPWR